MPSFNRGFYSQATASAVVKHATRLPSAAVFDCDFTLWPTHAEFHSPRSSAPSLYPAVFPTLDALLDANVPIAIASRTPSPNVCHTWLSQIGIDKHAASIHCYPSSSNKTYHLSSIASELNVPLSEMIFFDDEHRNTHDVAKLGVIAIAVEDGLTLRSLRAALQQLHQKHSEQLER